MAAIRGSTARGSRRKLAPRSVTRRRTAGSGSFMRTIQRLIACGPGCAGRGLRSARGVAGEGEGAGASGAAWATTSRTMAASIDVYLFGFGKGPPARAGALDGERSSRSSSALASTKRGAISTARDAKRRASAGLPPSRARISATR